MSVWTKRAERGSTWLIHLIAWLARVVGRPVCRLLLYPIVLYFMLFDGNTRRASAAFLRAARGHPTRWRDSFNHIYCFAATLLDRVYLARGEFSRFDLQIEGLEILDAALRQGRGCLLVGAHLGSFDLLLLAHRSMDGRPVSILMRHDPRSRVRRIAGIDDRLLDIIQVGQPDSYLRAYDALSRGHVVGVLADRADGGAQAVVPFLDRPAALPTAPHILAARAQAPVVACFGLYEGGNRYRIEFVDLGAPPPANTRGAALTPFVARYAALLEAYAVRYPLNWFNFYDYWQATERAS